ncbi:MAG: hypothetical protein WBD16_12040 [Pyrinomonadaceae bacterium]
MKTRIFAFTAIACLLLNFVAFASTDTRKQRAKKRVMNRLVSQLPASDGIAVFEARRFLGDALPQILTANQPVLGQIMAKVSEIENRTGIDLRKFDNVVVGVAMKQIKAKEVDFETVAIANGDVNAAALIAVAKLASKGTYREEQISGRTVFVFTAKDVMQKTSTQTSSSKIAGMMDKALDGLTKEIAVTTLDANTLVLGNFKRVRETLEAKTRPSADLTAKLMQNSSAVMSFAVKTPDGMSKFMPLDNDELGKNVDSIRFLSGSLDVASVGTSLEVTAQTLKAEQAEGLKSTLEGLQLVGKAILGGSKRADQQVYGRMLKAAKFAARGNEVTLDLLVPQADIDILIAGVK